ncbi:MAG: hypothetical protein RDV48_16800 [Candidatus Eremiobacteraeota bacterium]|nr:hypothetical protein [Candidatus Eremiobacteraeota bacterium]
MKKALLICILIIVCTMPLLATPIQDYVYYNLKVGQLIFREIGCMEQANQVFNYWMNGESTKGEAVKQLASIKLEMEGTRSEMKKLEPSSDLKKLHELYLSSNDILISSVINHRNFIEKQDLKADDIRRKLMSHLLSYIDAVYDCQVKNIAAQAEFQGTLKLEGVSTSIKDYFAWNNKVLEVMRKQVIISRDMEKLLIKLHFGDIDLEQAQKEEKALVGEAETLKKSVDTVNAQGDVKELNLLFVKSFDSYIDFHRDLENYLQSPSKDKSQKLQGKSKEANRKNFEFNEACFKFLEKRVTKPQA